MVSLLIHLARHPCPVYGFLVILNVAIMNAQQRVFNVVPVYAKIAQPLLSQVCATLREIAIPIIVVTILTVLMTMFAMVLKSAI